MVPADISAQTCNQSPQPLRMTQPDLDRVQGETRVFEIASGFLTSADHGDAMTRIEQCAYQTTGIDPFWTGVEIQAAD